MILLPPFASILGHPVRNGRWACRIHGGDGPNFSVRESADGREWGHCWSCGWHGDVVAFVRATESASFAEALKILGIDAAARGIRKGKGPLPRPILRRTMGPREATWAAMAEAFAEEAVEAIWSVKGRPGLEFLRGRGIEEATIRDFGFGFNEGWREFHGLPRKANGRPACLPPGIVFVWRDPRDGSVTRIKVRSIERDRPKDRRFAALPGEGGCTYYGKVIPGRPLIVAEGEIDAALVQQAVGGRAGVVTLGSASVDPPAAAIGAFLASPLWLIATDADEAGDDRAGRWMALAPRATRVHPPVRPPGKDWGDALAAGWDLPEVWASAFNAPPGAPPVWGDPRPARAFLPPGPGPLRTAVLALGGDEQELWDERAGFLEAEGLSRPDAERHALMQVKDLRRTR